MAVVDSRVLQQSDEAMGIPHGSPPRTTLLLHSSKSPKSATDRHHSSIIQKTKTKTRTQTQTKNKKRSEMATPQSIHAQTCPKDERKQRSESRIPRQTDALQRKSTSRKRTKKNISQPQSRHVSDKTAGPKTLTEAAASIRRAAQSSNSTMGVPKERLTSQAAQSLKNFRSSMGCPANGEEKDTAATGEQVIRSNEKKKKTKSSKRKKKQQGLHKSSKKNTNYTSKHQSDTKVQRKRRRALNKSLPKEDGHHMTEKNEPTDPSASVSPRSCLAFPDQTKHRVVSMLRLDPIAELSPSPTTQLEDHPKKNRSKSTRKNEKDKKKEKKHKKKRRKKSLESPSLKELEVQGEDRPQIPQSFTPKMSKKALPSSSHPSQSSRTKEEETTNELQEVAVSPQQHSPSNAQPHLRVENFSSPVAAGAKSLIASVAPSPVRVPSLYDDSRTTDRKDNRGDDDGVMVTSCFRHPTRTCGDVGVRRRRPSWTRESLWIPPLLSRPSRNILKKEHTRDDNDKSAIMDLLVVEPTIQHPSKKRSPWYQIEDPAPAEKSTGTRRNIWAGETTTRPSSSSTTTAAGEETPAPSSVAGTMHMTFFPTTEHPTVRLVH